MFRSVSAVFLSAGLVLAAGSAGAGHAAHVKTLLPIDAGKYFPKNVSDVSLAAYGALSGRGTAECTVLPTGRLTACTVVSETPRGYGFGQAVARLAADAVIVDLSRDASGERVTFTTTLSEGSR